MKKIRKLLLILSLSFYLTAVLTPQKEKEAHAFVLTGSLVLGALAIAGAGGVIAYQNRNHIAKVGSDIAGSLESEGISVSDMFASNKYGLTDTVKRKLAEQIEMEKATFDGRSISLNNIAVGTSGGYADRVFMPINIAMLETVHSTFDTLLIEITKNSGDSGLINLSYGNGRGYGVHYFEDNKVIIHLKDFTIMNNLKAYPQIGMHSTSELNVSVNYTAYRDVSEVADFHAINSIPTQATSEDYYNMINNTYTTESVSIDYDRLTDIMTNAQSEPISTTNLESLVSGLGSAIEDAGADTVGALNTIWNGIKNIPSLIQSSSTAVLGGISTLTDDLLSGLGNFTDNITKANEQLWEDAGAVWSGMTNAIEKAGADTREAITPALTGIDQLLRDMGSTLADLPGTIRTGVTDGLTGLNDTVTDLSSTVRTIPGAISTSVTDAFTSAFTVPDGYITDRVTTIHEIITPKLPRFPTKEAIFPSDFDEMGDWQGISVDFKHYGIGEQMVIDNEAPNYYRRQIKLWISAILYFFTALFVIRKVAGVINK